MVIVGGTTGLGLSAAKACAGEGARVVVSGRNPDSAAAAQQILGRDAALAIAADAADPASAAQLIATCEERFGRFDALYHVAGGSGRRMGDGPLHEITDEGWAATIALNQTTAFNSARAACSAFLRRGHGGSILLMGSVLGSHPSAKFFATHAYAATKSAVIGFARSCAAYYAPNGIRFNVIAPALVETPMAKRAAGDETILEFIRTKQPLDGGRIGQPEDLDAAVVWLLSDGSKFVTGQQIVVDGGWSVSEGQIPDEA
ncbi:MAG TPA: SDR family oxidoreductase [Tepidisphaeraceae bacterium]|nr:SDR family oxidoreductase [Tepidisphaeraceae bacterium]